MNTPQSTASAQLTQFTKIVSIADTFDAITSERAYRNGATNMVAFRTPTQRRAKTWDGDLVFQFIDAVGIYPPGSIVQLSTGEVAVVVESHPKLKLRPTVFVVKNPEDPTQEMHMLNLAEVHEDRFGRRLFIAEVLHPKVSGINLQALFDSGMPGIEPAG